MALSAGDHIWYYDGNGNDQAISGEQATQAINIPRSTWFPGSNPADQSDYLGNGTHIFNFVYYSDDLVLQGQPQMRHGPGSFAWLNNNPGNITQGSHPLDLGQIPGKVNWHNFMIFPDFETGFAAIDTLLRTDVYQTSTIFHAFELWAPAKDGNNPTQYAADVAAAAGVGTDELLSNLDDDQLALVQQKISDIEGSTEGSTITATDLPTAIQDLLNN